MYSYHYLEGSKILVLVTIELMDLRQVISKNLFVSTTCKDIYIV